MGKRIMLLAALLPCIVTLGKQMRNPQMGNRAAAMDEKREKRAVLIGTRVSKGERAMVGAAASFAGQSISDFMRELVVPAAASRLEEAARVIVGPTP